MPGAEGKRFLDLGDRALDRVSGLVWEKTPSCASCTWKAALKACQDKGPGWRLPDVKELRSLVDDKQSSCPMWDRTVFGALCPSPPYFWSSTPVPWSTSSAFDVSFNGGSVGGNHVDDGNGVRCVRAGPFGNIIFSDDFESYTVGSLPTAGG